MILEYKPLTKFIALKNPYECPPGGYKYNNYKGITAECVIEQAKRDGIYLSKNEVIEYTANLLYENGGQDYVECSRFSYADWLKVSRPHRPKERKLLICLIACDYDLYRGHENLKLNFTLQRHKQFDCIIFLQTNNVNPYLNFIEDAKRYLNVKRVVILKFSHGDLVGFPRTNNLVFNTIAEYVFLEESSNYSHFINLETDVCGLKQNWIELWWEKLKDKELCGYIGTARNIRHMNGMAIWPTDIIQRHKSVSEARTYAWDLDMGMDLEHLIQPANDFYVMQWNTSNYYLNKTTSTIHNNERPVMNFFDNTKILIHGCKDLTINTLINERIARNIM